MFVPALLCRDMLLLSQMVRQDHRLQLVPLLRVVALHQLMHHQRHAHNLHVDRHGQSQHQALSLPQRPVHHLVGLQALHPYHQFLKLMLIVMRRHRRLVHQVLYPYPQCPLL